MVQRKPRMETVKVTDARQQLSELLNRVFKERTRVVIEKSGIPVAALISTQDLERFDQLEAQRAERFRALEDTGEAFLDVPAAEIDRQARKAIAGVRAGKRRKRPRATPRR